MSANGKQPPQAAIPVGGTGLGAKSGWRGRTHPLQLDAASRSSADGFVFRVEDIRSAESQRIALL
jgi:hypothetical protein